MLLHPTLGSIIHYPSHSHDRPFTAALPAVTPTTTYSVCTSNLKPIYVQLKPTVLKLFTRLPAPQQSRRGTFCPLQSALSLPSPSRRLLWHMKLPFLPDESHWKKHLNMLILVRLKAADECGCRRGMNFYYTLYNFLCYLFPSLCGFAPTNKN